MKHWNEQLLPQILYICVLNVTRMIFCGFWLINDWGEEEHWQWDSIHTVYDYWSSNLVVACLSI